MTRAYNTATTQQNSGGAVPAFIAGKNTVLNSSFNVWQRGTSTVLTAQSAYIADRWFGSATAATTFSRQVTGDTTNLPSIQYCLRVQRNSGQTSVSAILMHQPMETVNSIPYAGKTVTLSFYARKGANFSDANSDLSAYLISGTGTDQNYTSGYTGAVFPINERAVLTTTWQRFSYTGTIATNATELTPYFEYSPTGTAGAADYFEITGVQLEVGSVATPYAPNSATYQGELAACQRYYYRQTSTDDIYSRFAFGSAYATTAAQFLFSFPVQMRVKPSALETSAFGTFLLWDGANNNNATAVGGMTRQSVNNASVDFTTAATMTQYRPYWILANNSTSAYVGFSAEL
jgi:hypothetical protein